MSRKVTLGELSTSQDLQVFTCGKQTASIAQNWKTWEKSGEVLGKDFQTSATSCWSWPDDGRVLDRSMFAKVFPSTANLGRSWLCFDLANFGQVLADMGRLGSKQSGMCGEHLPSNLTISAISLHATSLTPNRLPSTRLVQKWFRQTGLCGNAGFVHPGATASESPVNRWFRRNYRRKSPNRAMSPTRPSR